MTTSVLLLLLSFWYLLAVIDSHVLKEILAWKALDWKFKSKEDRESAIENERFVKGNAMATQIEYLHDHRIAITTPRFKEGIPATLSTIRESQIGCGKDGPQSPLLRPYPNWKWNNGDMACDGLTSVTAAKADMCGRLWVLDSGVVDMMNPYRTTVCSTKIVAFDLASDDAIREYTFGDYILKSNSILINLAVDVITCEQVYLYSADAIEFGLIVTDTASGDSWRIEHKLFFPYPSWGTLVSNRQHLDLMMGVTSLALQPDYNPDSRKLFFHSLAGAKENFVATRILRNYSLASSMPQEFYFSNGEATSQCPNAIFDRRGILFFSLVSSGALVCWNPATEHVPENIIPIAQNPETLKFITGLSVDIHPFEVDHLGILWTLSTSFIEYMRDAMNPDMVNFRIFVANTRDLSHGTPCEYAQPYGGPPPQYSGVPPPMGHYSPHLLPGPYPPSYQHLGG
ncbi:hypothetical protein J437_LFUL016701 [Ladona fulva]|uniref:Protein yellow n=1 Tax=Ladona fulva TaxID=123851 RepID=A0A8K0KME3_LADFU|nr:hypothetical protein J437_LFUL016701 [Ladona fulva]